MTANPQVLTIPPEARWCSLSWSRNCRVPAQGRYQAALTAINRTQAVINTAKERITTWAKGKYQAALTAINDDSDSDQYCEDAYYDVGSQQV